MTTIHSLTHLSDDQLVARVQMLAGDERQATAVLIASLAEFDARRLFLREGCSSLFTYCTQVLHLSEHAAYGRIEAARLARRFPVVLERLAEGSVTLTSVGLLAPHLSEEHHCKLLDAARHKSKRDVEHIVAALRPQADVPSRIRKLPDPKPQTVPIVPDTSGAPQAQAPAPLNPQPSRPVIVPLASERYKVQFTISRATHDKLRRTQDLLRHTIPNGNPGAIFDRALTLLLNELERTKLAAASRPRASRQLRPESRTIPAAVRREVWKRDGGRCAFVGTNDRCSETGFLEFHHVVPYADGGEATVSNIELRCRAHNAYEAEQRFGTLFVREARAGFETVELGPDLVRPSQRQLLS